MTSFARACNNAFATSWCFMHLMLVQGLFGRKGKEEGLLQQGLAASYGDLHTALEREKARTADLEESLQKVRLELKASQEEGIFKRT